MLCNWSLFELVGKNFPELAQLESSDAPRSFISPGRCFCPPAGSNTSTSRTTEAHGVLVDMLEIATNLQQHSSPTILDRIGQKNQVRSAKPHKG